MGERFQKFLDRIESRIALILFAVSTMSGAGISAWVATATEWLNAYGPIAWWFAALIGGLLTLLLALAISWARYGWVKASAVRKWQRDVDTINPLDKQYNKARIRINDLAHPVTRRISDKRFIECELMGPANICFQGSGTVANSSFGNCDVVALKPAEQWNLGNVIVMENVEIHHCSLWQITIFVVPEMISHFQEMGANFVSLIPGQDDDNQLPQSTEQKTQP